MTLDNIRKFRVDDDVWERAGKRAVTEGVTLSTLLRQWLADYVDGFSSAQRRTLAKQLTTRATQPAWFGSPLNIRNFRVDDKLWGRASVRALNEGVTLSALFQQLLEDYADATVAPSHDKTTLAEHRAMVRNLRQQTVLDLTRKGWSVTQIAAHLGVTPRTVSRDRAQS